MNELMHICEKYGVLVAAHRGMSGANIPCNTIKAFEIALHSGASILEMDLFKSADEKLFIFHTGNERVHLGRDIDITKLSSHEIARLRLLNSDHNETSFGIASFDAVLEQFKGRCLLNLDRCGSFIKDVVNCVERHAMREQILLKTAPTSDILSAVEHYAPQYMYMPVYKERDTATALIEHMDIHLVGAELVFASESSPIAQEGYITDMRKKGFALWANSLLYSEKVPLAGGHSDDISLMVDPNAGWGWLARRGFNIIQTDWTAQCASWLRRTGFAATTRC